MIDRAVGAVLAAAVAAGIVWASSVPLALNATSDGVLRLAWGARPERIETCREPRPEELANLPQHMRQARICEGVTAEYRLIVTGPDGVRLNRIVRGGGIRRDRPLYVFEELPVSPGAAVFNVAFERITHSAGEDDRSDEGAVPPSMSLDIRATVRPREVILVTYDAQRRELAVRGPGGS